MNAPNLWEETSPQPSPTVSSSTVTAPNLWEISEPPKTTGQEDSGYSLSGLGKNALQDVGRIATGLGGAVMDAGKTAYQMETGPNPILDPKGYVQNLEQTPIAQRIEQMPSAIGQGVSDFGRDPVGAMYRNPVTTALTAAGAIQGVSKVVGAFTDVPDLLDAGIKPRTLQNMTPDGVNPEAFAKTLQESLNKEGAIGKTPAMTFDKMYSNTQDAGASVGAAREAIAKAAGPEAVTVDAQTALKPIYDAWSKEANAIVPDNRVLSTIGKYYTGLVDVAKNQGGKLTLDDIHGFLQEIGPKVHTGSETNQAIFSKLYAVGMDAQKGVINTIAQQAGDETLAKNLLDSNARYSTYMRIMPDVVANTSRAAIKEGMSAFQRYGGPTIMKYAGGGFAALTGEHMIEKLYHTIFGE